MSKEQCRATDGGFSICELETGHRCRHREGDYTWMDEAVTAARALARQNAEKKDEGEALKKLLTCLESVSAVVDWKTDEHQKAIWFDAILERYRATT